MTLTVVSPWYQNGWILYPSVGGIFGLLLFSTVFAYRYYQERQQVLAYQLLAVSELDDARRVQMGLMPEIAPEVEGLEIAGRCVSANTVSGDFFDYLQGDNEIVIVVGDVTGHGMQGAMNAVMVDGILRSLARRGIELSPVNLMSELNNDLTPQLEDQMNVTMVIGLINADTKTLTLANAGHHAHPLLVRNGTVEQLVSKGMPLGMMAGISYQEIEFELQSGDVVVFMTDGIIEAKDNSGTEYQESGRLEQVLGSFTPDTSAEAMVSALINDATTFGADMTTEEEDDITVAVVKVL
ncbi:serine/threonine-protein phosphatase [Candidatus Poribacteria bacterium]|nr:serine/threonine-protein phosphatase [Candidatus Poribacteria bacterium]